MGFNIGVHSNQTDNNYDCYNFIDRVFYDFINSGENYGNESILIQSGKYYGLDLSPFLKLVYTWDEVTEDYINKNIQQTDFLLELAKSFQDRIKKDSSVCDNINYTYRDSYPQWSEEDIQKLQAIHGIEFANSLRKMTELRKKELEENPNPWKPYFEEGDIVEDLGNLINTLQCYRDKGVTAVYLTAG